MSVYFIFFVVERTYSDFFWFHSHTLFSSQLTTRVVSPRVDLKGTKLMNIILKCKHYILREGGGVRGDSHTSYKGMCYGGREWGGLLYLSCWLSSVQFSLGLSIEMCTFRIYPYLSHGRDFLLRQLPPTPLKIPI